MKLIIKVENVHCHYKNTSMQYTAIFHGCKNDNFHVIFFYYFIFLLKTKTFWSKNKLDMLSNPGCTGLV